MIPRQAEAYRRDVAELVRLSERDLRVMFDRVQTGPEARDALMDLLPRLTEIYGMAAATVAADWYDDLRDEAGVRGRFAAIPAELPERGRTDALARWGVGPMFAAEPDKLAARQLVSGGLQRVITDAGRNTVALSSVEDPGAGGWQRVGSGECQFCEMLISRGDVYSERTVDFASHDNCRCAAIPAFDGQPRPVQPYTPSDRNSTPADRKRVREYLAENFPR